MRLRRDALELPYAVAPLSIGPATGMRLLQGPALDGHTSFASFLPAVLAAARVGGSVPALAALVPGAPHRTTNICGRGTLRREGLDLQAGFGLYLTSGLGVAPLGGEMGSGWRPDLEKLLAGLLSAR